MKYLVVIFIFCVNGIYAQVYPNYLQTNPSQDADTANVAIYYGTGNGALTGRAHVVSFEHFAALIEAYISAGLSDGDKGDITVSGSGATWNIDANAVGANEIAANAVGNSELSPTTLSGFGITDAASIGLSNLSGVAINADLTPATTNTISLGANSYLWAGLYLANGGLKIRSSGSKNLVIYAGENLASADKSLSIRTGGVDRVLDFVGGSLTINSESSIDGTFSGSSSGTNTGDQDLSTVTDDRSFYDYGTTDMPVVSDDSIETTNVKYLLFNGLTGGLDSKIELLKESTIQIDHGTSAASRYEYYMKVKPLQQTDNNPNFNFTIASTDITGTKNNEVAMIGWNVTPGGSQEDTDDSMMALAFENNYETGGQYYNEFHLLHTDLAGNVRRPLTLFLDKDNPYDWIGAFHMNRFEFRGPETSDLAYAEFRYDTTLNRSFMKLRGLDTGNGIQHTMDEDDNLYQIGNDGLINPKFRIDAFDTVCIMNGKIGFGTEVPYAQFTNKGNVGIYSTYGTSGGTPIGPSLYLGDDGYYNSSFYDKAPGLSAIYNSAQGVASDLAFYAYNGARTERMRLTQDGMLGINDTTPSYTVDVTGDIRATGEVITSDEAYDATAWNGSLEVPTKNAVRDKIETLGGTTAPTTISPSQITSDQDNYNPTGIGKATYVRLDGDNGVRAITGIADSTAGTLEKTLLNIGSYPIYLPMDHPDSDAAHRFTGHNCDFVLYPGASVKILYDLTSTKWRIIGNSEIVRSKGVRYEYDAASVTFGELWNLSISAGGSSGTITATNATSTHSAHSLLSTSTSTTGAYVMYMPKASSLFSYFGSAHIATESLVSIPVLSDGTQTFAFELKLSATPAGGSLEENNMFGIRYSHSINSGEWELFSQSNTGTETVADLNVAVTADVLYKLRIEVDKGNTEARAYINDSYVGRVTATMPNGTAISASVMLLKSAGTTARTVRIHNISASAIYP